MLPFCPLLSWLPSDQLERVSRADPAGHEVAPALLLAGGAVGQVPQGQVKSLSIVLMPFSTADAFVAGGEVADRGEVHHARLRRGRHMRPEHQQQQRQEQGSRIGPRSRPTPRATGRSPDGSRAAS